MREVNVSKPKLINKPFKWFICPVLWMVQRSHAIENERVTVEVKVKEAAGIQKSRIVTLSF